MARESDDPEADEDQSDAISHDEEEDESDRRGRPRKRRATDEEAAPAEGRIPRGPDLGLMQGTPTAGESVRKTLQADPSKEEVGAAGLQGAHRKPRAQRHEERPTPIAPPLQPADETRELLRKIRQQEKMRIRQELAEARDLENKAKELAKRVKEKRRMQADVSKHSERVRQIAPQLGLDPSRQITEVPALEGEDLKQVEFTPVLEGRSFIRIIFDSAHNRYLYEVIEPTLSPTEREVLEFIKDTLVRTLEGRQRGDDHEDWEGFLKDAVQQVVVDHSILIDEVSHQRILYYILRDFLGYGPIDVMMRDPLIEDISCDGPGVPLYIFHRQYESIRSNAVFPRETDLDGFVIRLSQRSGKHISIAEPLLDATLPDTSRLQATLGREVTTRGSSFTIRKFRTDPLTPPDLVRLGTVSPDLAAYFWLAMEEGASIVFAGGTASGKTTTLNAICQFIPPDKKIVSIEDTREINLQHENWIAGLTRSGFGGEMVGGKPAGSIDMYKLLEAALRQRPEYLLVGEVRGPEALTLFQAMATGHATYSTLHADSVMSAVYRLENKPINVPRIMLQTLDVMAVQVQVRLQERMVRRLKEVTEVTGIDPENGDLLTNAVFRWDASSDSHQFLGNSHVFELIREKRNLSRDEIEDEWRRRTMIVEWMVEKGIRNIRDVSRIVSEYYRKPESLYAKVADAMRPGAAEQEMARAA